MTQFSDIFSGLEAKAKAVLADAEAKGVVIVQKLEQVAEDAFASAATDFGTLACQLVTQFLQAEYANLTGGEKHGQVVTGLVQEAEVQGKALAIADAQALAKNAFLAVAGALKPGA